MEITAKMVKELRDKTNAGMMDCKKALIESNGDMEKAVEILRKKGKAVASKRAGKETKEGIIVSKVSDDGKIGVLVEVNSETDFVAKNDMFKKFANEIAEHILAKSPSDIDELLSQKFLSDESITVNDALMDIVGKIGENIKIKRMERLSASEKEFIVDYSHLGGKLCVLVKAGFENDDTPSKQEFKEMLKNIAMQVAAMSPIFIKESDIPQETLEKEREIQKAQIKNKPEHVIDKIVEGKMKKYYSDVCLLHQPYVKEQKMTVKQYVEDVSKKLGDNLEIKCFVRFMVGEQA